MKSNEIREHIFSLKDEKFRDFSKSLIPGENTIIGVRIPVLRNYARELYMEYRDNTDKLLDIISCDYYEEILLRGMIIGMKKYSSGKELCDEIEGFAPLVKNWSVCDVFCAGLKPVKNHRTEVYGLIKRYLTSEEEYQVRLALVLLLDYYIDDEYITEVLKIGCGLTHDGYYAKMAAAWLLSICFVKYYDMTKEYMLSDDGRKTDDFIYNKALQKARESRRISAEQKAELQNMKR